MEGLVKEGAEIMDEDLQDAVMDAALIGAAERVEHYEIATYGTACAFATILGATERLRSYRRRCRRRRRLTKSLLNLPRKLTNKQMKVATRKV